MGETVLFTSAMFQANKGAKQSKQRPRISCAKNVPTDGNGLAKNCNADGKRLRNTTLRVLTSSTLIGIFEDHVKKTKVHHIE